MPNRQIVLHDFKKEGTSMASTTKKLKVRRKLRKIALGKVRKARAKKLGTTAPNLPLTKPNANENSDSSK